jgi:hypothetical protein
LVCWQALSPEDASKLVGPSHSRQLRISSELRRRVKLSELSCKGEIASLKLTRKGKMIAMLKSVAGLAYFDSPRSIVRSRTCGKTRFCVIVGIGMSCVLQLWLFSGAIIPHAWCKS